MRIPSYTRQFSKDLKKMEKRGKSSEKVKEIVKNLVNEESLHAKYKDHKLVGNFKQMFTPKKTFMATITHGI